MLETHFLVCFQYGSWTYDGFQVQVDFYDGLEEIDVNDFIDGKEWDLVGHSAIKNTK